MKLTQQNVAKIAIPPGKTEHFEWDDDVPGLALRLRIGGSATFIFQYRVGSRQRRVKLGSAKAISAQDARKSASQLHARVMLGEDPAGDKIESRAKAGETLAPVLKPYLAHKKRELKGRSYEETERHLLMHARRLHGLQLNAIDRRTVAGLLAELATNNGPVLANSVRASLSSFFSWAMGQGLAEANPIIGTNKAVTKGARDRVLTDDELRLIWAALGKNNYDDVVRLLALTGQRRNEIGGLRWSEVNFDKALISLPAERTKNSKPHDISLAPAALTILEARPRIPGRDHVFGANGFAGWANCKVLLDARIAAKGTIAPWRLHDLRRTVSTRMHDELGIEPHIVEAVLNHIGHKAGVAGTYNRATYAQQKAIALARWSEHLTAIVTGKDSKIVAISKGAAPR